MVKGGHGGIILGGDIDLVDIKAGTASGALFFTGSVRTLIYGGKKYKLDATNLYDFPLAPSTTLNFAFPIHGITRLLRVNPDSLTGVTDVLISGDGVNFSSILSLLTAGAWSSIANAQLTLLGYPNFAGYNSLSIRATTSGAIPAGTGVHVMHDCFVIDQSISVLSGTDTSVPPCIFSNGAPAVNASYFGQPSK